MCCHRRRLAASDAVAPLAYESGCFTVSAGRSISTKLYVDSSQLSIQRLAAAQQSKLFIPDCADFEFEAGELWPLLPATLHGLSVGGTDAKAYHARHRLVAAQTLEAIKRLQCSFGRELIGVERIKRLVKLGIGRRWRLVLGCFNAEIELALG